MATDPYWQLEKEYTTITGAHNLTIKAVIYADVPRTENGKTIKVPAPSKVHEFRVKREVLCAASPVWRTMLTAGFAERGRDVIDFHEDPEQALAVWFRIVHAADGVEGGPAPVLEGEGLGYRTMDLKGVWEMLSVAHKYEIDIISSKAQMWFHNWYNAQAHRGGRRFGYFDFQALLLPCYSFSHPAGFTFVTKELVYRSNSFITERQPPGFRQDNLRLPSSILQQLNAVKGRLKTVLLRDLYWPIEKMFESMVCNCREHAHFTYERALWRTGAWPLETNVSRKSFNDILRALDTFRMTQDRACGSPQCVEFNFKHIVEQAVTKTRKYFDGLCLDCMSLSDRNCDDHKEFWHRSESTTVPWDAGCRVRHKQPTWYFSYMGPRQVMIEWTSSQRDRRRLQNEEEE